MHFHLPELREFSFECNHCDQKKPYAEFYTYPGGMPYKCCAVCFDKAITEWNAQIEKRKQKEHLKVYIYALIDPRDQAVRYIGSTRMPRNRLSGHLAKYSYGTHEKREWIGGLKTVGIKPTLQILEETIEKHRAARETHWYKHYRDLGCNLFQSPLAP